MSSRRRTRPERTGIYRCHASRSVQMNASASFVVANRPGAAPKMRISPLRSFFGSPGFSKETVTWTVLPYSSEGSPISMLPPRRRIAVCVDVERVSEPRPMAGRPQESPQREAPGWVSLGVGRCALTEIGQTSGDRLARLGSSDCGPVRRRPEAVLAQVPDQRRVRRDHQAVAPSEIPHTKNRPYHKKPHSAAGCASPAAYSGADTTRPAASMARR